MGNNRNLAFWVVLFLMIVVLFNVFSSGSGGMQSREISYSEFVANVENGSIDAVTLDGEKVSFIGGDKREYYTIRPGDADVTDLLIQNEVAIRAEQQETSGLQAFLVSLLPFLLLIGVWIYFMNRMQGGGRGGAMGFGKSKAKLLTEKQGRVTFDDVAGIDEAKEELEEIVEFLRNPQKFSRLGGKIPRVLCLLVLRVRVKHSLRARLRVRRVCHSLPFRGLTLLKCLWVWVHRVCRTCSNRRKRMRHVSSLSTKSTPLAVTVAQAMAVETMNANRH